MILIYQPCAQTHGQHFGMSIDKNVVLSSWISVKLSRQYTENLFHIPPDCYMDMQWHCRDFRWGSSPMFSFTLHANCGTVYCNRSYLWVCVGGSVTTI